MTKHCSNHCAACGRHFSSVAAFDAHRAGPMDDRRCESPLDLRDKSGAERFLALAEDGECSLYGPPQADVTIWTLRAAYEAVTRHFREAA